MLSSLLTEMPSCGFSTSLALAVTKWQLWLGSKESFLAYFLAGGFSNAINAASYRPSRYPVPPEVTQSIIVCQSLLETQQLLMRQNRQRLGSPRESLEDSPPLTNMALAACLRRDQTRNWLVLIKIVVTRWPAIQVATPESVAAT